MLTTSGASPTSSPFTPPESALCLPDLGAAPKVRVQVNLVLALFRGLAAMELLRLEVLMLVEALAHNPVKQVDQVVVAVLVLGCDGAPSALHGPPAQEEEREHTVVAKLDVHLDTIEELRIHARLRAAVPIAGDALVLADVVHAKVAGEVVDRVAFGEGWVHAKHHVGVLGSCMGSAL